jgi:hypothetical protein
LTGADPVESGTVPHSIHGGVEGVGGGRVLGMDFGLFGYDDDFTRHGFCEFKKNKKGMGECIRKTVTKLRVLLWRRSTCVVIMPSI